MEIVEAEIFLQTKLQTKQQEMEDDVSVIILLYKNPNFKTFLKPFDIEIYGKKMWKWVELACGNYEIKTTLCTPESDILTLIKPMLTQKKYTLVLFSDTPLIKKFTIKEIITYAKAKTLSAMNLQRGYLFETNYIKNADSIKNTLIEKFDEEDFVQVFDIRQLEFVSQIIKNRILEFHQRNGVLIMDSLTTFIDADAIIGSGVIIEPLNNIKGKSYIGANCFLQNGNTIVNSFISDNCIIKNSYITNSKIDKNMVVGPFENVSNKLI